MSRQIFLDTETTGLDWRSGADRVVEIGCVEMIDRRLTGNRYHVYLNPEREVGDSERIHGLSDDFLADKVLYRTIAEEFEAFVAGAELIIHNASFDTGFLNMEQERIGREKITVLCPEVLDTVKVAKEMFPGKKASLDALCDRYGINNAHRTLHGALLDAELLAEVYLAMTRGQESLTIGLDDAPGSASGFGATLAGERRPVRVLRASDAELAEHDKVLAEIAKKAKCLWLPPAADAGAN
ncbi:DNA polymerase III subunit epsilon [Uliginosibacterium sp. 31-16]|uniref:DNA polymerase III subunit epsilon n=1 Tax=Uliginosibacterium sp. 31-16 TaxID=3068315 RepID=UPI00273D5ACC|nr:DNA polymerase III subunit epsilon [Uliginosibacterium sp. 31-16]MDP5239546.1 DNA polymerase III subunit epsilon [Uliginosibacterium sp. 31-16]